MFGDGRIWIDDSFGSVRVSHIKCLSGPCKGFEDDIPDALKVGDVLSIPHVGKYVHYVVSGFLGDNYLLSPREVTALDVASDD